MSGLDIGQAPPPTEPWRFLRSSLIWGVIAGAWWVWQGESALLSRWAPATVVSVHAWVLGMLGNAMLASLLQFLPVAANARLTLPVSIRWLHRGFNLGVAVLLVFFLAPQPLLAGLAVLLLVGTLGLFAWRSLVALSKVIRVSALHLGIAASLWSLLATVVLGVLAAGVLLGQLPWPLENVVNLHAALGLGGWCVGLLAAVGAVTVPMFQGARVLATRTQQAWRWGLMTALLLAVLAATSMQPTYSLLLGVALPCAGLASIILWMQVHSAHPRNPPLRWTWRLGATFLWLPLLLLALQWLQPVRLPSQTLALIAGASLLTAGLPLLVIGMQLEIVPFLAWIELRQRHPRGIRVPGVGTLLGQPHKQQLVWLHGIAALAATSASLAPVATRTAGMLIMLAHLATLLRLGAVWRHARAFAPA